MPVLVFMVSIARAQPVVQGVQGSFNEGGAVTIMGTGFGTKPTPSPVLWDTFENGTTGNTIDDQFAVIGDWDADSLPWNPEYSTSIAHSGSKSSYHPFRNNEYQISLAKNMTFTRLYLDFWIYVDYFDNKSRNWKVWRFYGDNDTVQLSWVYFCDGQVINTYDDGCNGYLEQNYWDGTLYSNREWLHIQLEYKESGVNQSNGSVHHFVNSALAGVNSDQVMTRTCSHSFSEIRIGHYWDTAAVPGCPSNSGADIYVDDVYIDTSWARVELGDQPTYRLSTHREVQVPTAWSNSTVSVNARVGSFTQSETVYLYVVDANGSVNANGLPVVVGGGAGLASPKNLRIVP